MTEEEQMFGHTHIKRSLAALVALGLAACPAAAQATIVAVGGPGGQASPAISAPVRQLGSSTQTEFNWADAGIGAGGAIVLVGVGAGSAVRMRRRRVVGVA